jgi:hypothetical protein
MEFVEHLEMYKWAEEEYYKLLKEGKEHTPYGEGYKKEMDYWWSRLSPNQKKECISSAKKELTEAFTKGFDKLFPKI